MPSIGVEYIYNWHKCIHRFFPAFIRSIHIFVFLAVKTNTMKKWKSAILFNRTNSQRTIHRNQWNYVFIFTAFEGEYMLAFRRIVTRRDRFLVNFKQHVSACVWSKLFTSDSISSSKFWKWKLFQCDLSNRIWLLFLSNIHLPWTEMAFVGKTRPENHRCIFQNIAMHDQVQTDCVSGIWLISISIILPVQFSRPLPKHARNSNRQLGS